MPWTDAIGTCICSKRRVTKMPSSSAVRSRSAASRQLCARRSPSKTPMVTFVLPTSMASSMVYTQRTSPDTIRCRPPAVRASSAPSSASPAVVPDCGAGAGRPTRSARRAPTATAPATARTSGGGPAVCSSPSVRLSAASTCASTWPASAGAPSSVSIAPARSASSGGNAAGRRLMPTPEHDVTHALGPRRRLGEDPRDLTPRAEPGAADRDDVVRPLDLQRQRRRRADAVGDRDAARQRDPRRERRAPHDRRQVEPRVRRREPRAPEPAAARRLRAGHERRPLGLAPVGRRGGQIVGRSDFRRVVQPRAELPALGHGRRQRRGEFLGQTFSHGTHGHDVRHGAHADASRPVQVFVRDP